MAEKTELTVNDNDVRNDGREIEMSDWSKADMKEYREKLRFAFETGILPKRYLDLKSNPDDPKAPCDKISENSLNAAIAQISYGRSLGLSPKMALSKTMIVNGEMTVWGDALPSIVYMSGLMEYKEETFDATTMTAICTVKRKDMSRPEVRTFSMEDAKIAGLWGKNVWAKYPKRMLQMRARTYALRDVFPEALAGMITTEEAYEIQQNDATHSYSEVIATPVIKKAVDAVVEDITPVLEYKPIESFADLISKTQNVDELVAVFAENQNRINPTESERIIGLFKKRKSELEQNQ